MMDAGEWNPPPVNASNCLLIRPELAKVKRTTYDLPTGPHTFGKPLSRDPENARDVTSKWKEHIRNPDKVPGKDFTALNRSAVIEGLVSAKDQHEYRLANGTNPEFRLKHGLSAMTDKDARLPSDSDNNFAYGKPTRPSTPIENVMNNQYQRSFIADQQDSYANTSGSKNKMKIKTAVKENKTSVARANAIREQLNYEEPAKTWKMKKFENVQSRLV